MSLECGRKKGGYVLAYRMISHCNFGSSLVFAITHYTHETRKYSIERNRFPTADHARCDGRFIYDCTNVISVLTLMCH